jgi:NitT/TauT family transport system substrate-binding protein
VIRRHGLDRANGFSLDLMMLPGNDAGRVAVMARSADIVVSDWFFAASRRAAGTPLSFAPFSSALGGVLVRADSPIRRLHDLVGRRLGVAGGPEDKSWLLVQAAAHKTGLDLARAAEIEFAAPPLLDAKLIQGELDSVLTFWTFVARLEASGFRQVIAVNECAHALGLGIPCLVGFVFRSDWAELHRPVLDGFLAAVHQAESILTGSAAEWRAVRPLMQAPDEALFQNLRHRFIAGLTNPDPVEEQRNATRILEILLHADGPRATAGLSSLPQGIFWPTGRT